MPSYIYLSCPQVTSQRMQGLLLLVFAKYFHLPFLRGVQTETTRTGLGGYWVRPLLPPFCPQHCIMDISQQAICFHPVFILDSPNQFYENKKQVKKTS